MLVSTLNRCKVGQRVYLSTREQRHMMDITPLLMGRIESISGNTASVRLSSSRYVSSYYDASRIFLHPKSQEWTANYALRQALCPDGP